MDLATLIQSLGIPQALSSLGLPGMNGGAGAPAAGGPVSLSQLSGAIAANPALAGLNPATSFAPGQVNNGAPSTLAQLAQVAGQARPARQSAPPPRAPMPHTSGGATRPTASAGALPLMSSPTFLHPQVQGLVRLMGTPEGQRLMALMSHMRNWES